MKGPFFLTLLLIGAALVAKGKAPVSTADKDDTAIAEEARSQEALRVKGEALIAASLAIKAAEEKRCCATGTGAKPAEP